MAIPQGVWGIDVGQCALKALRCEMIEGVLTAHPAVSQALVTLRAETQEEKRLVAYIVPASGATPPTPAELRQHAQEQLPDYMVPTHVVELPSLPLSPNGKVDRSALPMVDLTQRSEHEAAVAPSTPLQELLAAIWKEVLNQPEIGIQFVDPKCEADRGDE